MKLKYEFEKIEMDGEIMAVPVGDNADEFHALLRLNETAAFILDTLKEDTTEEKVVETVMKNYEGDAEEIKTYVREYIETLKTNGIVID